MNLSGQLASGCEKLGLHLSEETRGKLLAYIALIHKWNKVYNLTAIRDPKSMLTHHILDSLSVVPHIHGKTLLDVGCGAGLPGIPLALAKPDLQVTMLDSSHKKTTFVQQALIELGIGNAGVKCDRVEALNVNEKYDVVISRAFSDLAEFVKLAGHLVAEGGRMAAMKGVYPHEELALLPANAELEKVIPLTVPGLEANRHLIMIKVM
jgi:16S rRNA (guanine527-N7)-methyltransferase